MGLRVLYLQHVFVFLFLMAAIPQTVASVAASDNIDDNDIDDEEKKTSLMMSSAVIMVLSTVYSTVVYYFRTSWLARVVMEVALSR